MIHSNVREIGKSGQARTDSAGSPPAPQHTVGRVCQHQVISVFEACSFNSRTRCLTRAFVIFLQPKARSHRNVVRLARVGLTYYNFVNRFYCCCSGGFASYSLPTLSLSLHISPKHQMSDCPRLISNWYDAWTGSPALLALSLSLSGITIRDSSSLA